MRRSIVLPGSSKSAEVTKPCDRCKEERLPEGGIQMGPSRWFCAGCWLKYRFKK